jgi:hypothetical protein
MLIFRHFLGSDRFSIAIAQPHPEPALWQVYQQSLKDEAN